MRLALIPARGGSRRLPRKNVKPFLDKPVIGYTIETLIELGLFDHIVVSTDDEEIADISRNFGAEVPWLRCQELSDEFTDTDAVISHELEKCFEFYGPFKQGCCVYPVNPLLSGELLLIGLKNLEDSNAASSFPVVRYEFPVEQALILDDGHPKFLYPEAVAMRSQDLPTRYHDTGMFYWFDALKFRCKPALFTEESVAFEVDQLLCQDVNTLDDWKLLEMKYQLLTVQKP